MFEKFLKDEKGQTDSVFKVALVVIVIAAVLAVVAVVMGDVWSSTETIATQTTSAADTTADSVGCLTTGSC